MRRMEMYSTVRLKREPGHMKRYLAAYGFMQRMDEGFARQSEQESRWGRAEALELMGSGDDAVVGEVALGWLDRALGKLSNRERSVVERHFGIGCEARTYAAIGKSMGVSRSRIMQIVAKALRKMRCGSLRSDAEMWAYMKDWQGEF